MLETAFIIGSPRSGTTIMEETLERHPQINTWYEPVFVTDYYFQDAQDDERSVEDARPEVKAHLRRAFDTYRRHIRRQLIVDKNPFNSFRLPFLHAIFPEAKYIHMLRDGRDATLSIQVEWNKRISQLDRNDPMERLQALKRYIDRQPLVRHKLEAIRFEIGDVGNLLKGGGNIVSYRERRWHGRKGWGPRFPGWEEVIDRITPLEFNAMQWARSVEAIIRDKHTIPAERFLEIRYEDFLQAPRQTLEQIFNFLEVDTPPDFMAHIPELKRSNYNKWQTAFTAEDKARIGPILQPMLEKLGYETDTTWYAG